MRYSSDSTLWDLWRECVQLHQHYQQRAPHLNPQLNYMYGPDGQVSPFRATLGFSSIVSDARDHRYPKPWIVDVPSGLLPPYAVLAGPDGEELVGCTILGACIERGWGHAMLGVIRNANPYGQAMGAPYRRPKSVGATAGRATNALHELAVKVASSARGETMFLSTDSGGPIKHVGEEPYLFVLNTVLDAPYPRYKWWAGIGGFKRGSAPAPHIDDLVDTLGSPPKKVTPLMNILEFYINPDPAGRGRYVVKLLLGAGANPNAVDSTGKSAVNYLDPNKPENQDVINALKVAAAGFPPPPPPPETVVLQNHIKTEKPSLSYFYPNYMTPNVSLQAESEQAANFSQYLQTIMPPNTDKSITDAAGILTLYDLVVLISDPKSTNLTHFERPLQALENIYTIVHGQAGDGIWKLCWLHHTEEIKDVHTAGEITTFLKNHPRAPGKPPPPSTPGENDIALGRELQKKIVSTHITATPWPPAGHNYERPLIVLVLATGYTSGEGPPNSSVALRDTMSDALKAVTPTRGSAAVIFVFARIGAVTKTLTLFKELDQDSRFISAKNTAQRPTETNLATGPERLDIASNDNKAVVMLVKLLLKPLTTKWDSVVP